MTRKYFFENGNEIAAYSSIEALKTHIAELQAEEPWEDDIIDLHSGVLDGHRYYGIGGNGTQVEVDALDNFDDWWESNWDEEVHEL